MAQATVFNPVTRQRKTITVGDPNAFAGGFILETPTNNLQTYKAPTAPTAPVSPTTPKPVTAIPGITKQATQPTAQPTALGNVAPTPIAPIAPATPTAASTYIVQPGDTLTAIAQKLGVQPGDISGFKSNNPNLIFPKEVLSIMPRQAAPVQPTPVTPVQPTNQPTNVAPGSVPSPTNSSTSSTPEAGLVEEAPQISPEEKTLNDLVTQYNSSFTAEGFANNPQKSIKDLVTEIMDMTGLPETKNQIVDLTKQIEALNNERDAKIAEINDNPWLSESIRISKINKISTEYENKTANRVNQLTLLQGMYDDARQQAEFAATTALNVYDNQRAFDQNKLEFLIGQAEKTLEAKRATEASVVKTEQKAADAKAKMDDDMTKKGYTYVNTPKLRDELKAKGYDIVVNSDGRTYAKPGATYTVKGVVYNKNTGKPVNSNSSPLGSPKNSSSTPPAPGKFNETVAKNAMATQLKSAVGPDGFLSPDDYLKARIAWVKEGGNVTRFDTLFKGYKNPNNPYYITNKSQKSSGRTAD